MKTFIPCLCLLLVTLTVSVYSKDKDKSNPQAKKTMLVRYQRPESPGDSRNAYHIALLKAALEKTEAKYGPFRIEPARKVMNEIRIVKLLEAGSDEIDVLFRPTSIENEKALTPVRIPLDKGLLGYRISLIRKEDQPSFRKIKTLAQLKKKILGQGRDWNDVSIYQHNNMQVITGSVYEGLFEMLAKKRFDYFPRGVEEAFIEYEARKDKFRNLHVEETFIIHYPFVRYFWVANSKKGDLLRKRLTEGLEICIKEGVFDKLFMKYKGKELEKAGLDKRRTFQITNPDLPKTVPTERPELWFDPYKDLPHTNALDAKQKSQNSQRK